MTPPGRPPSRIGRASIDPGGGSTQPTVSHPSSATSSLSTITPNCDSRTGSMGISAGKLPPALARAFMLPASVLRRASAAGALECVVIGGVKPASDGEAAQVVAELRSRDITHIEWGDVALDEPILQTK